MEEAVREAPSVEHVVTWERDAGWGAIVEESPGELPPLEVPSEHPYLLTYTSGTTGKPKGVLHVQGGFLVSITREVAYQADVHPEDVLHFSTDMGWIMGPWTVVGGGALGCTLVFAEGAPDRPVDRLWRLVEEERVSVLGLSPTLVRALIPHGEPEADLSSLRIIVTTGEPWNPDPYRWLFERVGGGRRPIINCSGGTEVAACFLSPTPAIPIKECSLGGPALGMAMDVVDADGASLVGTGEVGELVCRKPFPGMTRGFWRDPERYLDTYWRRLPGVWVHGDWASVDEDGYWFLHGRSDDTLNIAGKRIGPAELESAAVCPPRRRRGRRGRRPARGQGRGRVDLLRRGARPRGERRAGRRGGRARRSAARQGVQAGPRRVRSGAPEDAKREDRPARRAREGAGRRIPATSPPSRTPSRWRPLLAPSEYEGTPTRGYLDSATYGLPPRSTLAAMEEALAGWRTGRRWRDWEEDGEACRSLFAGLVGAQAEDVALVTTTSSAAGLVAASLPAEQGVERRPLRARLHVGDAPLAWARKARRRATPRPARSGSRRRSTSGPRSSR